MKIEHDGKYCPACTENSIMPSLPKCNDEKIQYPIVKMGFDDIFHSHDKFDHTEIKFVTIASSAIPTENTKLDIFFSCYMTLCEFRNEKIPMENIRLIFSKTEDPLKNHYTVAIK